MLAYSVSFTDLHEAVCDLGLSKLARHVAAPAFHALLLFPNVNMDDWSARANTDEIQPCRIQSWPRRWHCITVYNIAIGFA